MFRNTTQTYGSLTKFLHWSIFILVCIQFYFALVRKFFPPDSLERANYMLMHKSFGITLLIISILFILWRISNLNPSPLANESRWKQISAKIVQHSLLLLLLIIPVLGYLMANASGKKLSFFGLFFLPDLISANKNLSVIFNQLHEKLSYVLLALLSLHVLASLHHHFILKNNVLSRMLYFK